MTVAESNFYSAAPSAFKAIRDNSMSKREKVALEVYACLVALNEQNPEKVQTDNFELLAEKSVNYADEFLKVIKNKK